MIKHRLYMFVWLCLLAVVARYAYSNTPNKKVEDVALGLKFVSPGGLGFVEKAQSIYFELSTETSSTITLTIGGEEVKTVANATQLTYTHVVTEDGGFVNVVATATAGADTESLTLTYQVMPAVQTAQRPAGTVPGVNYIGGNTSKAVLVLHDPAKVKAFAYVVGDFTDWEEKSAYLMKKSEEADGNYFWLELNGLQAGQEYAFQYWIDGGLKLADPYAEKVLNEEDSEIATTVYPDLKLYPEGKTEGAVAVLETGAAAYTWQSNAVTISDNEDLVIYEMHIRDFTSEGSFKAAISRLDYLKDLGVNTVLIMPVMEFEGNSSQGYNPLFYFAPDKSYGTAEDLKALIDAIHGKGMAVVLDIVLNHTMAESPLVKLYSSASGVPTAINPWYNGNQPHVGFTKGYDLDHANPLAQQFVDRVNAYWLNEFKVDGLRFDFSNGFTNVAGNGWQPDASRVQLIERMADEIWKVNQEALVVLDHDTDYEERKTLAAYGLLVQGNENPVFRETSKGGYANLEFQYAGFYEFENLNLISFMESHDQERLAYEALFKGRMRGDYNITDMSTAFQRLKQSAAFFLMTPGPKMLWQFGELGYDVSLMQNEVNGALSEDNMDAPKPVLWSYADEAERKELYELYKTLLALRETYNLNALMSENVTMKMGGSLRLKEILLTGADLNVKMIGNFGMSAARVEYDLTEVGNAWFDYFAGGKNVPVNGAFILGPGEFKLLVSKPITFPKQGMIKEDNTTVAVFPTEFDANTVIKIYFDPAKAGSALSDAEEVHMASGIVLEGPESSKVVDLVNDDNEKGKMVKQPDGSWQIIITPSDYFDIGENELPYRIGMYFRNAEGTEEQKSPLGEYYYANFKLFPEQVWLIGSMMDWSLTNAQELQTNGNGEYSVIMDLQPGDSFKFIDALDYSAGTEYGSDNNVDLRIADGEGGDISLPEGKPTGTYKVVVNLNEMTVSFQDPQVLSTAKNILSYNVDGFDALIDQGASSIRLVMPDGTDLTNLAAVVRISTNATISPDPSAARDYTSPVVYTVTAEDGSTQEWVVTISAGKSTANDLLSFTMADVAGAIDGEAHTVQLLLPTGNDIKSQSAVYEISQFATITPDPGVARDYSSPVVFTVVAEDGTSQEWTVTVQSEANGLDGNALSAQVLIYPNPFGESFNMKTVGLKGDINVRIFDLTGRLVWQTIEEAGYPVVFSTASFHSGMYMMEIVTEEGRTLKRIIKQ
ncbi:DUF5018 domain-containing protein [Limibacter armeniacum]|uniref:DUF4961 domain-containing protein n=1 Tax=Limibacter armeniacum TaxID=466084 RepID=UPI002FE659A4